MMTIEAQKELRKQFVAALRSGKYKQAKYRLFTGDAYCCLGVACVVAGLEPKYNPGSLRYEFDKISGVLPESVKEMYGFSSDVGGFNDTPEHKTSLAYLNDMGKTGFDQMADLIESEPKGMFVND